jgi:hypothetical protein
MRERLASQAGLLDPPSPGPAAPRVIVTGGHAAAPWASRAWCQPAGPSLPAIADELDPELVLRGLGLLAEHIATRPGAGALP